MDRLDRLLGTAWPLLRRVDDTLGAGGAPPEHAVWTELRRVRLLPADAVRAVAALHPGGLDEAAVELLGAARSCAEVAESLPAPGDWAGAAAEAYDRARLMTAEHLAGAPESLDSRLRATSGLAESLAAWMRETRESVAGALADILLSTEAVTLAREGKDIPAAPEIEAAAQVATRILRAVADAYDHAADLLNHSSGLAEPTLTTR